MSALGKLCVWILAGAVLGGVVGLFEYGLVAATFKPVAILAAAFGLIGLRSFALRRYCGRCER